MLRECSHPFHFHVHLPKELLHPPRVVLYRGGQEPVLLEVQKGCQKLVVLEMERFQGRILRLFHEQVLQPLQWVHQVRSK